MTDGNNSTTTNNNTDHRLTEDGQRIRELACAHVRRQACAVAQRVAEHVVETTHVTAYQWRGRIDRSTETFSLYGVPVCDSAAHDADTASADTASAETAPEEIDIEIETALDNDNLPVAHVILALKVTYTYTNDDGETFDTYTRIEAEHTGVHIPDVTDALAENFANVSAALDDMRSVDDADSANGE